MTLLRELLEAEDAGELTPAEIKQLQKELTNWIVNKSYYELVKKATGKTGSLKKDDAWFGDDPNKPYWDHGWWPLEHTAKAIGGEIWEKFKKLPNGNKKDSIWRPVLKSKAVRDFKNSLKTK